MSYKTKSILTDLTDKPIPQYFDAEADDYIPAQGRNGAQRIELYGPSGIPIATNRDQLLVKSTETEAKLNSLLGSYGRMEAGLGAPSALAITNPAAEAGVVQLLKGILKQLQGAGVGSVPISTPHNAIINGAAITPSDTVDLTTPTTAIFVGSAGDIKVDLFGSGDAIVFRNLSAGTLYPICATRVYSTDTTAQDLVGISSVVSSSVPVEPDPTPSVLTVDVTDAPYSAVGDGVTDDTAAIQSAIDYVSSQGGGVVAVPAGTYMINLGTGSGLTLRSNIKLSLAVATTIQAMPTSLSNYSLVKVVPNSSDVEITGGELKGEREAHTGVGGEWGHCIVVAKSTNVSIHDIKISNSWGDCIYVIGLSNTGYSQNVTIKDFVIDNARRNGISIISGKDILIENGYISNTNGTNPQSAIDLEPNYAAEYIQNVHVKNVIAENTVGYAFQFGFGAIFENMVNPIDVVIENFSSINHGYGKYNYYPLFMEYDPDMFFITIIGESTDTLSVASIITSMTSGWFATGGSVLYQAGAVILTGGGTTTTPRAGFNTAVACVEGHKVYVRATLLVPDVTDLSAVLLRAVGSTGGTVANIKSGNPTANTEINLSGIYTIPTGHTGNIRLEAHMAFATAAVASGKPMQIKSYEAVDLTAVQGAGSEMDVVWCDENVVFI